MDSEGGPGDSPSRWSWAARSLGVPACRAGVGQSDPDALQTCPQRAPTPPVGGRQGTGLTGGKCNAFRLAAAVPGVCVLSRSPCSSFLVFVSSQNPTQRGESPAWLPPPIRGCLVTTGLGAVTQMCLPHRRSVNFHLPLLSAGPLPSTGGLLSGPGKGRGKRCFSRKRPLQ